MGSLLRGYPEGEADKAKQEHIDRLAAIANAQEKEKGDNMAARGVSDLDDDPNSGKDEKKQGDTDPEPDKTRGKGKEIE